MADDAFNAQHESEARRRGLAITADYLNGQSIDALASKYELSPGGVEERIRSHGGKICYCGGWPDDSGN